VTFLRGLRGERSPVGLGRQGAQVQGGMPQGAGPEPGSTRGRLLSRTHHFGEPAGLDGDRKKQQRGQHSEGL
jgi:hypothetical protein